MIGRVFDDRYEVIAKLGSGGMADVYLAHDRVLGRKVALKVLHASFAHDDEFIERFRREASSAAGLNHPNIVQIYDRGEAEGTYYIAMEYLEGRSLKDIILKYAPLSPDLIVSVSRQIVEALRYVHRRDIIHRDIKPQNIIVDHDGRVKVTDFGIARAGSVTSLTESGVSIGTAAYLSPEQAQGQPVEAASDLYSLGVVMYEMATGRLPFSGDNAVSVAMQHVHDQPVAPRNIVPAIPENLEAVILRALGKQPIERYLTAQAMLDDIWRVQEGQPVNVPPGFVEESTQVSRPADQTGASGAQATMVRERFPQGAGDSGGREVPPEEDYGEPLRRRSLWPWVAVAVLLIALILTGVAIAKWGGGGELGVIPGVVGLGPDEAKQKIEDAGFKFKNEGPQASADVAEGLVADQKPKEGTTMAKGGAVSVWISSGAGPVTVPNVVGMDRFDAVAELEALGLDVLQEEEVTEDATKHNLVMQQEPVSGNIVQAGATVTIWIAVPSDRVLVPNLLGMSQAAAEIQLTGRGLVAQVELVDSEMTGGTVVGQDPEAGTEVEAGATVIVRVSNAPVVQVVQVPLVGGMGYTLDQAQSILALYHLNTSIEYEERVDFLPGIVIRQHPAAGVVVPAGSYVHLIVAKEPTTTTEPPTTTTTTLPEETTTTLSPETTTTTITPTTTPTL